MHPVLSICQTEGVICCSSLAVLHCATVRCCFLVTCICNAVTLTSEDQVTTPPAPAGRSTSAQHTNTTYRRRLLGFCLLALGLFPASPSRESQRNPPKPTPEKMAPPASTAADGGIEENAMAILDTSGIKDSRDLHDDRTPLLYFDFLLIL